MRLRVFSARSVRNEYAVPHSMRLADALIAAAALEQGFDLIAADDRHYRHIDGLGIDVFRP